MSTGVVTTITTDWRGDTLSADAAPGALVLHVESTIDFDEDGGWLVIGNSAPREYTGINDDNNTVTLDAIAGSDFEAGLPVVIWDETVANGGSRVVEYVATVDLHDGTGSVDAVIPHGLIPVSSVDLLIGASVRLEQNEDGDWSVGKVLGREAVLSDIVGTRFLTSVEGKRVVVTTEYNGAVLFYTGSAEEDPPNPGTGYLGGAGFITSSETDFGGGDVVLQTSIGGPTVEGAPGLPTLGLTTSRFGAAYETTVTMNADRLYFNGDRIVADNLYLEAPPTTPNAVNVRIGPGGQLLEVVSGRRFKQDIEDAEIDRAAVLQIAGRTWRDKAEVAADPDATNRYIGVIADELDDLGLTDFVEYDDEGPRAVKYDRLTVALLAVAQDQERRLARIEATLGLTD